MKPGPLLLLVLLHTHSASCLAVRSVNQNGGHAIEWPPTSKKATSWTPVASLRSTFLPSGFPHKTPKNYLRYSLWNWIQDWSTQLRAVVATQRVLQGVGVGSADATALSALLNFLVRDGCGMVASLMLTSVTASKFAADVKRWRLMADILVDLGLTLEWYAVQSYFLPLLCLGNMCKAMCGVAAGACGGPIALYWAQGSDVADVNAKAGAQGTVTGGLGLIVAALFAKRMSSLSERYLWAWYSGLTAVHLFANGRCMRLLEFDSLNTVRMNMVLSEYLQHQRIPSRENVAQREPLLFGSRPPRPTTKPIRFGISFNELVEQSGDPIDVWHQRIATSHDEPMFWVSSSPSGTINVSLSHRCTSRGKAEAYFAAVCLARGVSASWDDFAEQCESQGWDLSKTELQSQGYEVTVR